MGRILGASRGKTTIRQPAGSKTRCWQELEDLPQSSLQIIAHATAREKKMQARLREAVQQVPTTGQGDLRDASRRISARNTHHTTKDKQATKIPNIWKDSCEKHDLTKRGLWTRVWRGMARIMPGVSNTIKNSCEKPDQACTVDTRQASSRF
jgi:hypothetical protein